jgi:hypothetical protein
MATRSIGSRTIGLGSALLIAAGAVGGLSVGLSGCIIQASDDDGDGGGGAGGGDPGDDPCNGVPVQGECLDENTIRSCFTDGNQLPDQPPNTTIVEVNCGPEEKCEMGPNGAMCQVQGDCYAGETRCKDANTLQICDNNAWFDSSCGASSCVAQPGFGAACLSNDGGSGLSVKGKLEYQFLVPNSSLTDFGTTPQSEGAVDFFVTVYDFSNPSASLDEMLVGMALTSFGTGGLAPGEFVVPLDKPLNEDTFIYFWPILFDNQGQPRMGIAKAENGSALHQQSDEYWSWGFETCPFGSGECGVADLGTFTIKHTNGPNPDENAGAAHIYQWLDYGIFRFEDLYPGVKPLSFGVFWNPGTDFDCGNCFAPPQLGGSTVVYDPNENLADHYQSTINISGSNGSPTQWSKSVINHEFGHWSMQSYTRSPGEGGPHYVNEACKPGLAYSEGYATFTGQSQISASPSNNDPIYFTKKSGTVFWIDISNNTWDLGGGGGQALALPNPNGPINQNINENVVAGMFWSFWAQNDAVAPQGLGETPVYAPLRSSRILNNPSYNRGYATVDFIDYLDAMKCGGHATDGQIAAVTSSVGYPWDNNPNCP